MSQKAADEVMKAREEYMNKLAETTEVQPTFNLNQAVALKVAANQVRETYGDASTKDEFYEYLTQAVVILQEALDKC